jgi:xanthine dehydrogenase small subunit
VDHQADSRSAIIWLARAKGLDAIADDAQAVTFGAAVTHADAAPHLAAIDPDLGELLRRFASKQVRNVGTLGGNIANGSPIGDTPPALIALGATLVLQRGAATRELALEEFFTNLPARAGVRRQGPAFDPCPFDL